MLDKLAAVEERYEQISLQLSDGAVVSDQARYKALMKEYKQLSPVVEAFRQLKAAKEQEESAESLLSDPEFKELAQEEFLQAKRLIAELTEQIKILLLPRDPNDERNVVMEIRGGTGGEEAALFAGSLLRMYQMYADSKGWQTEISSGNQTELGGWKEVVFTIEGQGAFSRLKFESGVHRVQRVPDTEAGGRIHTSAVTVAVLPEAEDVDVELLDSDLLIETHRSAGAGGQHVNKTESAIRVIHIPTGLTVDCQDERSQGKNKEKALKILRSRLYEKKLADQNAEIADKRRSMVGSGDRSERIRTYNFPQGRVTDHRIGLTLYRLNAILDGDIDELVDALVTAEQAEKLKGSEQA
ncbi:MAG: peptide chain release factor 1 [Clostridia bacterium]|nr:peptide chain release factor 1 [Clostridia bacterium]